MSESSTVSPDYSAGALLRLAREQQGMHIAILAAQLKVPVKKVQALEDEAWTEFASPVFVRTLAASACRALKVDATPVLARLPEAPNLPLSKPSRVRDDRPVRFRTTPRSGPSRTTLWVAGGLAVLTLLVAFTPEMRSRVAPTPVAAPEVAAALPSEAVVTDTVTPLATPMQVPEVPAATAGSTPVTAPTPLPASPPTGAPAPSPAPAATAAPVDAGVLAFHARLDGWVQVADAQGQLVLSRVLKKGEKVTLASVPPLKVVVGRVDGIEVLVRGKPYAMADVVQGNVARFEVK